MRRGRMEIEALTPPEKPMRFGDWIQMNSGIAFWPLEPRAQEVRIEDIAHSLSMLCRFGGHCRRFYSVAEHSVHVARLLPPHLALWGLLHDASEAYVCDLPTPLKRMIPAYEEIEARVQEVIADRFSLPREMPAEVKAADHAMLLAEARQLMKPHLIPWNEFGKPADVRVRCWTPERAFGEFIVEFDRLMKKGA